MANHGFLLGIDVRPAWTDDSLFAPDMSNPIEAAQASVGFAPIVSMDTDTTCAVGSIEYPDLGVMYRVHAASLNRPWRLGNES